MTLLIGTLSDNHAVITTDGLSRVNPVTGVGVGCVNFQKVFPVPDLAMAFAHHGFNILGGKQIREFIETFISDHRDEFAGWRIKGVAENLQSYTRQAAEIALQEPSNKNGVVGFWIVGFSAARKQPELYEICWPQRPDPFEHKVIVLGGEASKFIDQYREQALARNFQPKMVPNLSVGHTILYHNALYKRAESLQQKAEQEIFGGCQQQLVLERTGWRWTKPPMPTWDQEK